jgi:predicted Fe-S protein YdhL (DUF1289 family)
MTLGDFMDVLGRLHKLTPAQRRAVAEVLAEPDEVQRPAEASEPVAKPAKRKSRPHYTPEERLRLRFYATNWNSLTEAKQLAALSSFDNRTESQVQRMIHKYRTGK